MSIQVDVVRIAGFRGISNVEITLPRVTLLIGQNNSGKTSVIKALQLSLGDYGRFLSDEDFHINATDSRNDEIVIDLRLVAIASDGSRTQEFTEDWQQEFKDSIQQEANEMQFVGLRTIAKPDKVKGGFIIERFSLDSWPEYATWKNHPIIKKNKFTKRFESIPYVSIDAQRDIHNELKEKSSFIGRVLSSVEYDHADVISLEKMVAEINKEAIDKSEPLKNLKKHLDQLNHSFEGSGETELTPFPKKIRDLSKRFSVSFGETDKNSFSMEYHGMGTRSWASMLTVKAFTELMARSHEEEAEPFFPIIATEEPEAHLHPNAQRTLYKQLIDVPGQVIISTHSPYLAGLAKLPEIRVLNKNGNDVQISQLRSEFGNDDLRKIQREVIHSRGELLFAKAIALSEGETEEQALPELFEAHTGFSAFSLGINFIGVNGSGAKYKPFLMLAKDLNIPVFIFSDGEELTTKRLKKTYEEVFGATDITTSTHITVLDGTDFEGYLLDEGYEKIIEETITEVRGVGFIDQWIADRHGKPLKPTKTNKPPCITCKQPILEGKLRDYSAQGGRRQAILEILDAKKTLYAKAVTEKLITLEKSKLPPKIVDFFEKIRAGI